MSTTTKSLRGKRHSESKNPNKKQVRNKRQASLEDEEEEWLTQTLFGGTGSATTTTTNNNTGTSRALVTAVAPKAKSRRTDDSEPLFSLKIDRVGDATLFDEEEQNDDDDDLNVDESAKHPRDSQDDDDDDDDERSGRDSQKPAWVDEDDAVIHTSLVVDGNSRLKKLRRERAEIGAVTGDELNRRLRQRFQSTTQTTARTDWADVTNANDDTNSRSRRDDDDNDDDVFKSTSATFLATETGINFGSRVLLPPNLLGMKRCPDANLTDVSQATVQAVHFHPASNPDRPILLTAGLDKTLRFFSVTEEASTKIHGIHFPKLPIYSASFLGATGNVVVTGRRSFFYLYDSAVDKVMHVPRVTGRLEKSWERCVASPDGQTLAMCGNDGYVVMFDTKRQTGQTHFKLNGSVRALAFTPDSSEVIASGSDGDVYRWDLRSQKCLERFANQDGTITSALAASNRLLAVGAESGVVNLYSEHQQHQHANGLHHRTPVKSIMNLKTSADVLRFNADGQILALSSRREKSALKLLHVPSRTVFANWPTSNTPLGHVWSMDFSPSSKFLVMGNDQGKCLLYKVMHYANLD